MVLPTDPKDYLFNFFTLSRPQNMIAQSQSGTGKTAAFVLAMLSRVDTKKNHPQVWQITNKFKNSVCISFSNLILNH